MSDIQTKQCHYCAKEYTKPHNVGNPAWGRRKYCSPKCHNEHKKARSIPQRRYNTQTKTCPICNHEYPKTKDNARTWGKKKYCSNECYKIAKSQRDTKRRQPKPTTPQPTYKHKAKGHCPRHGDWLLNTPTCPSCKMVTKQTGIVDYGVITQ